MTTISDLTMEQRMRQDNIFELKLQKNLFGLNSTKESLLERFIAQQTENEISYGETLKEKVAEVLRAK